MEFQTKKQKKDHLRLVNNIAMQGPVRCTDWSKTPITFIEQDLQLESYPHADAMVIQANRSTPWEKYHSQCPLAINKTQEQSISPST
jgi:regulation of enolase protein 1 (concanavalin A-like superfamily)